jgi:hypothetical protein
MRTMWKRKYKKGTKLTLININALPDWKRHYFQQGKEYETDYAPVYAYRSYRFKGVSISLRDISVEDESIFTFKVVIWKQKITRGY